MPMSPTHLTLVAALLGGVACPVGAAEFDANHAPAAAPQPSAANNKIRPVLAAANLHLKGGLWFDGKAFRRMDWYAVDGRLTAARPDRVDATINLKGRYVTPPLAEAHNHDLQNAFFAAQSSRAYLARGIFYSGQMAAVPSDIRAFRGLLNTPGSVDAAFSEVLISSSDGHPLAMALESYKAAGMQKRPEDIRDHAYWSVDSVADLDARWRRIAAAKPSLIKIMLIDSANHAENKKNEALFGRNGLDPSLVPEIVRRAHGIAARVVAHAETSADFTAAVAGGADIIAHLPGYKIGKGKTAADYRLTDAAIAQAATRGVTVITTTSISRYAIAKAPQLAPAIMGNYADNIRRLRDAGVKIAFGSDDVEGSVIEELETVDRLQVMGRAELLRIVTDDTARLLFPNRAIGKFAEGAEASLLAYEENPLTDLHTLRSPQLAIKQGELLSAR